MPLNLLDALFRSLNSIKSGNEVCRRVPAGFLVFAYSSSIILSFPLSPSLSLSLSLSPFQFARFVPSIIESGGPRFFVVAKPSAGSAREFARDASGDDMIEIAIICPRISIELTFEARRMKVSSF